MQNFLPASIDSADLPLLMELQRRRTCRSSLLGWCTEALVPIGQTPAAHHRLLVEELEKVTRGFRPPVPAASATTDAMACTTGMRRSASVCLTGFLWNCGYARLMSRRMNSRITAPMKATMMEPIMPPPVEIPSTPGRNSG